MESGLTPALRELKDCRHTFASSSEGDRLRGSRRGQGCITCNLAARVMADVEREQKAAENLLRQDKAEKELLWARARRNLLLMRHPTNWASSPLLQGSRPERPKEAESDDSTAADPIDVDSAGIRGAGENGTVGRKAEHHGHDPRAQTKERAREGGRPTGSVGDNRPKLAPGAMLTLSHLAAEAVRAFTEEVLGEEDPKEQAKKAMAIVMEATSEVAFANRRGRPRTGVLVTKLQAVARGWIARRRARVLVLRGGCRRELDIASGAWQYVWSYRAGASAAAAVHRRGNPASGGAHPSSSAGDDGVGGAAAQGLCRSWYPPALLKNETLPSPRAAARRVEGEERKREARLILANSFLGIQRAQLKKREVRAVRLLALADVVKMVERATASLEDAAVGCFGIRSKPLCISVRVFHPRGGQPGDGARQAVASEIMAAWHRADNQVRERKEAARLRAEASSGQGKTRRQNSPSRGGSGGEKPGATSPERREKRGGKRDVSVPTTNDNLAEFEKRLLQDSLHEDASAAVASILQRKKVLIAIHEASRVGRNKDAWEKTGTSPFGIGIQVLPPWASASHRFIALAHRGSLVAVSQASPFVFWETLANRANLGRVLEAILGPFLENADLLEAMFVGGQLSSAAFSAVSTDTNARRFTTSTAGREVGNSEVETPTATGTSQNSEGNECGSAAGDGLWGYCSSLSCKGCWKVDAWTAAQRDPSVELGFDSVAFDIFVTPEDYRQGREGAEAPLSQPDYSRVVVSNVVPFRLADGLPRELGPLLFEETADASLLGGGAEYRPPSRGTRNGREKHPAGDEPEGEDSVTREEQEGEEDEEDLWIDKEDPRGCGPMLSHVRRECRSVGGVVEVRLRAKSIDSRQLARAGLPQDMSALVVDVNPEVTAAGNSKRIQDGAAGAAGVSSGGRQGVQQPRAAAH